MYVIENWKRVKGVKPNIYGKLQTRVKTLCRLNLKLTQM